MSYPQLTLQKHKLTALIFRFTLVLLLIAASSHIHAGPDANGVLYVKKGQTTGNGSGDSWENAIPELADALEDLVLGQGLVQQIWVAQGTYYPSSREFIDALPQYSGLTDRDNTFLITRSIQIYGGFVGTETDIDQRTLGPESTILSGDIGTPGDPSDNCYHVIATNLLSGSVLIDNLSIQDGNADVAASFTNIRGVPIPRGGGSAIAAHNDLRLKNVILTGNNSLTEGICRLSRFNAKADLEDIQMFNNTSLQGPAAILCSGGTLNITNARITGNRGSSTGYVMRFDQTDVTFTNSTITGNHSPSQSSTRAAIRASGPSAALNIRNSIITGNTTLAGPANLRYENPDPNITSSIIAETYYDAEGNQSAPDNITADNLFVNSAEATDAPTAAGDYRLRSGSFAIDAGDNQWFDPGQTPDLSHITTDLDNRPRLIAPAIDLGSYESDPIASPDTNGILYVNKAHTGPNQIGDSWETAITELGTALDEARSLNAATPDTVKQIWVAQGIYHPTSLPTGSQQSHITLTDRDKTFILVPDVQIYGGFTGTETAIEQRTLTRESTILSGDIGTPNDPADNCYHVVVSAGNVGSTALDTLTIQEGNADFEPVTNPDFPWMTDDLIYINDQSIDRCDGAGLYISHSSPHIRNVDLTRNSAVDYGGACLIDDSSSHFENINIFDNTCGGFGAAMESTDGAITITNARISGNLGGSYGFAITAYTGTDLTITNSTLSGNRGTHPSIGAAVASMHTNTVVKIRNSIVSGNLRDVTPAEIMAVNTGTFEIHSSLIGNDFYDATGTVSTPADATPDDLFLDPVPASTAPNASGDYRLKEDAFAISAGDNTWFDPGQTPDLSHITTDLDNNPRIIGSAVDLGAYEFFQSDTGPNAEGVLFVDQANTSGNHRGDSWENAIPQLATALDEARDLNAANPGLVKQIWVAQGTYRPATLPPFVGIGLGDRDKTFILLPDVDIYGGFIGTETTLAERTLAADATILSGDIGAPDDPDDNTYHVIVSAGDVGTARLDTLTISHGQARFTPGSTTVNQHTIINGETVPRTSGGGISIIAGSPILHNIIMTHNTAEVSGGACYINTSGANLENTQILANTSHGDGAAIRVISSDIAVTNALITGNVGHSFGFAIHGHHSNLALTNTTVSGNRGIHATNGAALASFHDTAVVQLRNSMITGNTRGTNTPAETSLLGTGTIQHYSTLVGSTFYHTTDNPSTPSATTLAELFITAEPAANAPTVEGNYRLREGSHAINNGDITWFDSGLVPDISHITFDLDHNPRVIPSNIDLGPYESNITSDVSQWSLY